jgi:hypothetical protein
MGPATPPDIGTRLRFREARPGNASAFGNAIGLPRRARYPAPVARLADIVLDCERPAPLARWWASTLDGYRVAPYDTAELDRLRAIGVFNPEDDPNVLVEPLLGVGPRLWFQRVPEHKEQKNRLHLDLRTTDLESEVARLIERGGVELYRIGTNITMADPEGNEFCINAAAG